MRPTKHLLSALEIRHIKTWHGQPTKRKTQRGKQQIKKKNFLNLPQSEGEAQPGQARPCPGVLEEGSAGAPLWSDRGQCPRDGRDMACLRRVGHSAGRVGDPGTRWVAKTGRGTPRWRPGPTAPQAQRLWLAVWVAWWRVWAKVPVYVRREG